MAIDFFLSFSAFIWVRGVMWVTSPRALSGPQGGTGLGMPAPGGGLWSMPHSAPAWPTSLSTLGTLQCQVRWAPEGRADLASAPAPRIRVHVLVPCHGTGVGRKDLISFAVF